MHDVIKKKVDAGTGTPTKKLQQPDLFLGSAGTTGSKTPGSPVIDATKPKVVVAQTPADIARQKSVEDRLNATSNGSTKPPVVVQTPPVVPPVQPHSQKPTVGSTTYQPQAPQYSGGGNASAPISPLPTTTERIDSPTVDKNGAPIEEEKVPASGQPGYGETGSGSTTTTSTTGSGSSATTTSTGTTTTTGGTTTPETPTGTNPFYDQLKDMKFEYDPFSDPDYLETAAAMENQVAQMMVGRGGLYSSVTQAAFQSRLISLQNDMRQQKYDEWTAERDFIFDMAQFEEDRQNTKFEQDFAIAEFNLRKQDQEFQQSMALAAQRQAAANSAYNQQNADAQKTINSKTNSVVTQAQQYESMKRTYDFYYDKWKKNRYCDTKTAAYFGVAPGTDFSKATYKINSKAATISAYRDYVLENAKTVKMDEQLLDDVAGYYDNRYTPPKKSPKGPVKRETV